MKLKNGCTNKNILKYMGAVFLSFLPRYEPQVPGRKLQEIRLQFLRENWRLPPAVLCLCVGPAFRSQQWPHSASFRWSFYLFFDHVAGNKVTRARKNFNLGQSVGELGHDGRKVGPSCWEEFGTYWWKALRKAFVCLFFYFSSPFFPKGRGWICV